MKRLLAGVIILLVLSLAAFSYWSLGNTPANRSDRSSKIFVIEKGSTVREIGNSLKKEGLIRDPVVFFVYVKVNNQDKNIQAGDYRLSPSMNLSEIVEALNHGILDIWVTIPEGMRSDEIADILEKQIPSYQDTWRGELNQNEGYLFPDTYLVPRDADIEMVVSLFKNNFNKKIESIGLSQTDPKLSNIVTTASLIEREAITNEEKPLISGILANRLELGMALQVDATIQYVKGTKEKWWPQITTADYKSIDSSYNTYLVTGLPPGPIANPGIEAIKAALSPMETPYLYYIHAKGKIYPAKTVEEHNENVRRYL
jgi:UPF0755 protein